MFFPKVDIEKGIAREMPLVSNHIKSVSARLCDLVGVSLHGDSFIVSSGFGNAQMVVVPWTSLDGIHWVELWADSFSTLTLASSFPNLEYKKLQTIGAFVKFAINFQDATGLMPSMAAMIEIMGCGRGY